MALLLTAPNGLHCPTVKQILVQLQHRTLLSNKKEAAVDMGHDLGGPQRHCTEERHLLWGSVPITFSKRQVIKMRTQSWLLGSEVAGRRFCIWWWAMVVTQASMCDEVRTIATSSLCPFLGFDSIIKEEASARGNWMKDTQDFSILPLQLPANLQRLQNKVLKEENTRPKEFYRQVGIILHNCCRTRK